MNCKLGIRRSGFTLIELLVVLAIIVALFAILTPNIISYRARANERTTKSQLGNLERALEDYASDFGRYPTNAQGLRALIFIPADEAGTGVQTPMQPNTVSPGMPGADPNMAFGSGATAVGGVDAYGTTPGGMANPMNPMDPTGGMGGMQPPMNPNGGMGGMPGTPMDMTGGMGTNPMDPNAAMGGGMAVGGTMMSGNAWTQPTFNPQLYPQLRKRSSTYLTGDDVPLDPWKNPYRYDNTMLAGGINRYTGERKPAIWSAGPDQVDGTEDDIRNWDPQIAQQQLMNIQQGTGAGGMTNPMNPMNPMDPTGGMGGMGGMQPPMNPMDPTGGMGGMGGMQPPMNPMDPTGGTGGMGGMQPPMPQPQPMPTPQPMPMQPGM